MNRFIEAISGGGGPMMWPLWILAALASVLFLERLLYLHRGQIRAENFLSGIRNLLEKGRLMEALTLCEETPGPVPKVVKAALLNHDQGHERILTSVRAAALVELPSLEKRIGTLAVLARVFPLVGLLGTLVALLDGFTRMGAAHAYADASIFSSLVSEALVSSAVGLCLAIFAILGHHFLDGRLRAIVNDLEWAGNDICEFLLSGLFKAEEARAEQAKKEQKESKEPTKRKEQQDG